MKRTVHQDRRTKLIIVDGRKYRRQTSSLKIGERVTVGNPMRLRYNWMIPVVGANGKPEIWFWLGSPISF